jgi:hypothetical protein
MTDFLHWPHGFGSWYDLVLLAAIMSFKFDRGRTMWKRSRFIDRLGASFIASDFAMGTAYGYALALTLHPALIGNDALRWVMRTGIGIVVGWAWLQMRLTKQMRLEKAVSGDG